MIHQMKQSMKSKRNRSDTMRVIIAITSKTGLLCIILTSLLLLTCSKPVTSFTSVTIPRSKSIPASETTTSLPLNTNPFEFMFNNNNPKETATSSNDNNNNNIFNKFELPSFLGTAAPFGLTGITSGSAVASVLSSSSSSSAAVLDPTVEAKVFTSLSHLGLDLISFFGPGILALRMGAVIGRLCSIAADYIPDHFMLPEEFVFQLFMLSVAMIGVAKAAMVPIIASAASNLSLKDGKAYINLFKPSGTTWTQYKALSFCAMDWIELQSGETITDEDGKYIYWLYKGEVECNKLGSSTYKVSRHHSSTANSSQHYGLSLLGERRLLKLLDGNNDKTSTSSNSSGPLAIRAASDETTTILLRLHTPSIKILVENDQALGEAIRTMIFHGMEAKLDNALQQQQ